MHWLIKSEPNIWSIDDQKSSVVTCWNGVRNFQAQKYMKTMKCGDLCFFYHSNIDKAVVGLVKVVREAYLDPTCERGKFLSVDVEYVKHFLKPVHLKQIKGNIELASMMLNTQPRLSVMPVNDNCWKIVEKLGN